VVAWECGIFARSIITMTDQVKYRNACIAEYIESGYTLFKCAHKDITTFDNKTIKAKAALVKGWNNLAFNPNFALDPPLAFGVKLDTSDIVLDYDPRRDPEKTQLKEFIKLLGYTTPLKTLIVRTVSGGLHVYLKKSPKQEIVYGKFLANYPAIEVKKIGNYVIGAGSVINGVQYKIIRRG
jgi:hypothetical protein